MYQFDFFTTYSWLTPLLVLWILPWKGYALWKATKSGAKVWFIVLLILNTGAILEILYIFIFSKKSKIPATDKPAHKEETTVGDLISYEEFQKVHLRIAKITDAEQVPGSEKLLKLQLELGGENRQIVAGIGKAYNPQQLIGHEIVIVANMQPRSLMGVESKGMLLASHDGETPVLLMPEREVPSGSKIS